MIRPAARESSLRSVTRESARRHISDVAIDLFASQGFANVTVEQIAVAAGMSPRSFHRYFPAKEDAVVGDPSIGGELVTCALAERPADEPIWVSLRLAYEALLDEPTDLERGRRAMHVVSSAPSLRARSLEKHMLWAQLLLPIVQERIGGDEKSLEAHTLVHASLSCFDTALTCWAESLARKGPIDELRKAFATMSAIR